MTVNKISNAKLATIKRKSAYALPDNPTGSGMSAEKIKNAFWTFALDENDSIVSEVARIVDETNSDMATKEDASNKGVSIADNTSNTVKYPTAKDVADYVQNYAEPELTKNSAFNKNFETNTSNIKANGTASVGSLNTVARADHVHPVTYASTSEAGVVQLDVSSGLAVQNGKLKIDRANDAEITARTNATQPIVPQKLNFAVLSALTDANHITMSAEQQATAQNVFGITILTGNSAPTTSTEGYVGQLYLNMANNNVYQCLAITSNGGSPETFTYTWSQVMLEKNIAKNGFTVGATSGSIAVNTYTSTQYQNIMTSGYVVGKGTLENIKTNYVKEGLDSIEDYKVERLVTIYDRDSQDATINQGYTSGMDFPNNYDRQYYISGCTEGTYSGLYLTFESVGSGSQIETRVFVPHIGAHYNRFSLIACYQGNTDYLFWGHGIWDYDSIFLYELRQCNETTTTIGNSTGFKLIKVEGVLK